MVLFAGYENNNPDFRRQHDVSDLDVGLRLLALDCLMLWPSGRPRVSRLNAPPCWKPVFHIRPAVAHVRGNEGVGAVESPGSSFTRTYSSPEHTCWCPD